jgi:hypothetical protein
MLLLGKNIHYNFENKVLGKIFGSKGYEVNGHFWGITPLPGYNAGFGGGAVTHVIRQQRYNQCLK